MGLVRIAVAADLAKVTVRRVREQIARGRLEVRGIENGRYYLVDEEELLRLEMGYKFTGLPKGYLSTAEIMRELKLSTPSSTVRLLRKWEVPSIPYRNGYAWWAESVGDMLEEYPEYKPYVDGWDKPSHVLKYLERLVGTN